MDVDANVQKSSNDQKPPAVQKPQNANETDESSVKKRSKTLAEQVEDIKKHGNVEFIKGNDDRAITLYTQALSMCPESEEKLMSELYNNRAVAYYKLKNYENCVDDCNNAIKIMPMYTKAISRRSRAFAKMNNLKLALVDITAVNMINNYKNLADIEFSGNIIDILSMQHLEEYMKNKKFNLPSKMLIDVFMKSFCDDPFNDEFPQTLVQSNVNTGLELALKCIKVKNYEGVEEACKEELIKADNSLIRRSLAINLLATFNLLRGNFATSVGCLTSVIETPGVPKKLVINSLIKRALIYQHQKQVEKSFEDFKRAENIDPGSSEVFLHRARIYTLEMCTGKSVKDFKRAVKLNPKSISSIIECCFAQYIYALEMSNKLDAEHFLWRLKGFIINYPEHAEMSYTFYARALKEKGAYEEADNWFKKCLEIYPQNAAILVDRALNVLLWKNSSIEAIHFLEQALKIDATCCNTYVMLERLYNKTGRFKEAIECLDKAIDWTNPPEDLMVVLFSERYALEAQREANARFGLKQQH